MTFCCYSRLILRYKKRRRTYCQYYVNSIQIAAKLSQYLLCKRDDSFCRSFFAYPSRGCIMQISRFWRRRKTKHERIWWRRNKKKWQSKILGANSAQSVSRIENIYAHICIFSRLIDCEGKKSLIFIRDYILYYQMSTLRNAPLYVLCVCRYTVSCINVS